MIEYGFNLNFWFSKDSLSIDINKALDEISLTGWDGVELLGDQLEIFYNDYEYFADLLKLHNLKISSYYSWLDTVNEDFKVFELDRIKRKCDFLKKLGCKILLIDGGARDPNKSNKKYYKIAVDLINEIGQISESFEMKCSWHMHWGSMFDSVEDFTYLMDNTDSSLIGFCPDTAQLFLSRMDPVKIIKKYSSRINYIHFKDIAPNNLLLNILNNKDKASNIKQKISDGPFPKYKYLPDMYLDNGAYHINSKLKFTEVGRGIIDFGSICKEIREMNYIGWIVVDQDYTEWPFKESLDVNLKNIKYLMNLKKR